MASVGLIRGQPLPLTTTARHICHFRHALALDEHRVKFLPEYVVAGTGEGPGPRETIGSPQPSTNGLLLPNRDAKPKAAGADTEKITSDLSIEVKRGDIKEVWFAGTHSDM